jgi:hypothetical protein
MVYNIDEAATLGHAGQETPWWQVNKKILLRGSPLKHGQGFWGSTEKLVFSFKIFTFYEANACITTKMVQLLKPLNLRELYTT